jgi:hypothetical protein
VKAGLNASRNVERCDAEIDGFGLMIDLHVEWRSALPAKSAMPEAAGSNGPNRLLSADDPVIRSRNACENHCRRPAIELAGPAMAPACIERLACELVADVSAHAATGPFFHAAGLGCDDRPVN